MGTSVTGGFTGRINRDHPHACGDKQYPHIQLRAIVGSSPRVWGQVPHCRSGSLPRRIIPTRVGTSTTFSVPILTRADHPHACGDKQCLCIVKNQRQGSSPRVWGQDTVFSRHTNVIRIIPTRVGTRENYASVCPFPKDHPHACGDKFRYLSMGCTTPGSSPRVWGQAIPDGTYKAKCRIIPTRVGTSTSIDTNAAGIMDHPHACGDKSTP